MLAVVRQVLIQNGIHTGHTLPLSPDVVIKKHVLPLLWNNLENSYKACIDIDDFKKCLQNWAGPTCSCSYCILCILNLV